MTQRLKDGASAFTMLLASISILLHMCGASLNAIQATVSNRASLPPSMFGQITQYEFTYSCKSFSCEEDDDPCSNATCVESKCSAYGERCEDWLGDGDACCCDTSKSPGAEFTCMMQVDKPCYAGCCEEKIGEPCSFGCCTGNGHRFKCGGWLPGTYDPNGPLRDDSCCLADSATADEQTQAQCCLSASGVDCRIDRNNSVNKNKTKGACCLDYRCPANRGPEEPCYVDPHDFCQNDCSKYVPAPAIADRPPWVVLLLISLLVAIVAATLGLSKRLRVCFSRQCALAFRRRTSAPRVDNPILSTPDTNDDLSPVCNMQPERRVALIIYQDDYTSTGYGNLSDVLQEGEALVSKFGELGFHVIAMRNAVKHDFTSLRKQLVQAIQGGAGALIFIWFAGHGGELGGKPFLVPVDASVTDPQSYVFFDDFMADLQNINVTSVAATSHALPVRHAIFVIVLDCCRDAPKISDEHWHTVFNELINTRLPNTRKTRSQFCVIQACDRGRAAKSCLCSAFLKHVDAAVGLDVLLDRLREEVQANSLQRVWVTSSVVRPSAIVLTPARSNRSSSEVSEIFPQEEEFSAGSSAGLELAS